MNSTHPIATKNMTIWHLTFPFWKNKKSKKAWLLLSIIIAFSLTSVFLQVVYTQWYKTFYNALKDQHFNIFLKELRFFTFLALTMIAIAISRRYLVQMLSFIWRQWLTESFLGKWLNQQMYYHLEQEKQTDNPDQRISDDIRAFSSETLELFIGILVNVATLCVFTTMLWQLAGSLETTISGIHIVISGYLVWAAALYAIIGSFLIQAIGKPLVPINYQKEHLEADFRFGLVRIRENAEQIAFYRGEKIEKHTAQQFFQFIRQNWWQFMKYSLHLNFTASIYTQIAIIFPFLIASPRYFAGAFDFGTLMQISVAFGTVSTAFSWFIQNYANLASWKATANRLCEFANQIQRHSQHISPIDLKIHAQLSLSTKELQLHLPDGTPMTHLGSLTFEQGSHWLIQGASGSGKSTFLRALSGLWTHGSGSIYLPERKMMFIPQNTYTPFGSLKAALTYPDSEAHFNDQACQAVLETVHLSAYRSQLHLTQNWDKQLSPGELQRLAFARALLQKPDTLFLDEATSALDSANEKHLYQTLHEQLKHSTIISVAHRNTLDAFHEHQLIIERI